MFKRYFNIVVSASGRLSRYLRQTMLMFASSMMLFMSYPAHSASVDIADAPLTLGGQIQPNVVYLLDDSGSMHFELMPESLIEISARYIFPRANDVYGDGDYYNHVPTVDDGEPYNAITRSSTFNTVYYNPEFVYEPWTKSDGSKYDDADPENAYHNPENTGAGSRDLTSNNTQSARFWIDCDEPDDCDWSNYGAAKTFYPATYFDYDGSGDEWEWTSYTKVEIKPASDGGSDSYTRTSDRTDCGDDDDGDGYVTCSYDQEIQNFANWYQYYRSRILAARAGSGAAFAQLPEPADANAALRVGFATLNTSGAMVKEVRPFIGSDRDDFFDGLYGRDIPNSGTPTRRALDDVGQYYSRTDDEGPWNETPGTSGGDDISCRQSYTIVMTDGYWANADADTDDARDNNDGEDGDTITGPDGASYQYIAESPFADTESNTLADVAMYYWKRDLRTDLTNNVEPTLTDPAFWQHMVTYGVTLGVSGTLSDSDEPFDAIGNDAVTFTWTDPDDGDEEKVDDLIHAAVNSRGAFVSAQNPKEFAEAMVSFLTDTQDRTSSSASIAANSTTLDTNTFIYQASYDSTDWSGKLLAFPLAMDGTVNDDEDAASWNAADLIPDTHTARSIYSHDGSNGIDFIWSDLSASQQTALGSEDMLNYIRGDQSNEIKNGGTYRNRDVLLGDIVNSSPWFSGQANFGYSLLHGDEGDDYVTYINSTSYKDRTEMLYFGANDGMLHAINANNGEEVFTYVPRSIYDKLPSLADETYNHKYYVDGSPRAGDAYVDLNSDGSKEWRTILLGSTGAGGKSVFALDVTDPDSLDESDVLWEFTDPELGYTIGQPTIVRLANGDWGAIFGNGYNSDSQSARIFIVNLETGNVIKELDTGVGDSSNPNGMATPLVVDVNGDRIADRIYAGDLLGNVWRFDIDSSNTSQWKSPFPGGDQLFTAVGPNGETQPITSKPQARAHSKGGYMIYFGTGKYFEHGDNIVPSDDVPVHSFYGIHDTGSEVTRSDDLLEQKIIHESVEEFTNDETGESFDVPVRAVSKNDLTTQSGWYVDLVSPPPNDFGAQGERVIAEPLVMSDRIIFNTFIPSDDPCGWGGDSWIMELEPLNGAQLDFTVFDLNRDGLYDSQEYITIDDPKNPGETITIPVSGRKYDDGITGAPKLICSGDECHKVNATVKSTIEIVDQPTDTKSGRQSWEQVK